ncbi:MAG: hypothetical protein HY812_20595, partial [Planctomycetes bacterium]|nr:hypothetical protein [Planctomycetota bacterium]
MMNPHRPRHRVLIFALVLPSLAALPAPAARAQGDPGAGVNREATWPAPAAEDWKRPCLITWQRTWEDALAVSRETGKAILVCINMDGEIASEHYAGVRYRSPEIAALYGPYVTVIASVYRHSPRDYDEQGRRIPCPRFGGVTCGEHIAIEPVLYELFMDGRRIAPRHIMVELDGSETYDVFYAWDTASVFQAIEDGIAQRAPGLVTEVRGDRPIVERVASRDSRDRVAVEDAYLKGDRPLRQDLLEAALQHGDAASPDLLRLAVFGLEKDLGQLARRALAVNAAPGAAEVINEALRTPLPEDERESLVAALERLGGGSPRARTLAAVHRGLAGSASVVDAESWAEALAGEYSPAPVPDAELLEARIAHLDEVLDGQDSAARLELSEAFLARALDPETAEKPARLLLMDARSTALGAEELGAKGWRTNAVLALAAWYLGDRNEAFARAEAAVADLPSGAPGWNAMAVLDLFARMRWDGIVRALRAHQDWPKQWLTDIHAACSVLARHPLGSDSQIVWHYDRLKWLGAAEPAARVLDEGLARFPQSWDLHDRLRTRALEEKGTAGLEAVYEELLRREGAPPEMEWFAGYASLVAAEFERRAGRAAEALAAYDRGIAHYEKGIAASPGCRDTADHYVALALAGRARLALERADLEAALAKLLESFARKPEAAGTPDGLNISPADTARVLRARLAEAERADLLARLEAALSDIDPELLALPAYEREVPAG